MSNLKEILKTVAEQNEISQVKARAFYDSLTSAVAEAVKQLKAGEKLALTDLVTFRVVDVEERTHRNPQTGEEIVKPAHQAVKVKLPSNVKALV